MNHLADSSGIRMIQFLLPLLLYLSGVLIINTFHSARSMLTVKSFMTVNPIRPRQMILGQLRLYFLFFYMMVVVQY